MNTEIILFDEPDYLLTHDRASGQTEFSVKLGQIDHAGRKRACASAIDAINAEIQRDAHVFGGDPKVTAAHFLPIIDGAISRALLA